RPGPPRPARHDPRRSARPPRPLHRSQPARRQPLRAHRARPRPPFQGSGAGAQAGGAVPARARPPGKKCPRIHHRAPARWRRRRGLCSTAEVAVKRVSVALVLLVLAAQAAQADAAPSRRARSVDVHKKTSIASEHRSAVFNVAPRGDAEVDRQLQSSLDGILGGKWLKTAINGVYVVDVKTGKVLYA